MPGCIFSMLAFSHAYLQCQQALHNKGNTCLSCEDVAFQAGGQTLHRPQGETSAMGWVHALTLLHLEWPKLNRVLDILGID